MAEKKNPKAFLISGLAQELPSNVGVSLSSVPRSPSRASRWSSVGLLLEPVAVTPGMPASSRGEEQSTEVAGLCWALHGCPCPGSAAAASPALLGQAAPVLSLCLKHLCVHHCGIYPQVLGLAVPEQSKLPGCLIDIFLGGESDGFLLYCVNLPFTMSVPR